MEKTIYCVEDDDNIRELVVYALKSSGFNAVGYGSGQELYEGLKIITPDLILLDIMLPDEDGLSILRKLKKNSDTESISVIMLTAKTTEYDKITGLDLGADDYVTKPFGVMELMSRIKAVLRRSGKKNESDIIEYQGIKINNKKHIVLVNDEEIILTFKEYELLLYLMKNRGIVLSRDKLLETIWNIDYEGESRTVDVHIGSLRQKLLSEGSLIKTIRGVGYKMEDV